MDAADGPSFALSVKGGVPARLADPSFATALPINEPRVRTFLLLIPRTYHVLTTIRQFPIEFLVQDRKSTRLNSSHPSISYAVFCLKKKTKTLFCARHCGCSLSYIA